nr:MAG TPA: hypothetical protein [Caudoviricetes sp.]
MTFTLYNQDGVVATAQEVYNAYTTGVVLLRIDRSYYSATRLEWADSSGGASDETNVVGVVIYTYGSNSGIAVGTVPGQVTPQ